MTHAHSLRRVGLAGLIAGSTIAFCLSASAAEVTQRRLENAASEAQNWLMVYQQYSSYMHSNLRQINRDTVSGLRFKFSVALGGITKGARNGNQESTPLVNDGYMYVNNAWNEVHKIDVRSGTRGEILWTYDPAVDPSYPVIVTSRGIALLGNNVYIATLDNRLIAVDTESGEAVMEVNTKSDLDIPLYETITAAPLAVKDMILVGTTPLGRGARGRVAAYNAESGDELWKFYTIPGPGEPGHETWADDHNAWAVGSTGIWTTASYDPNLELAYYGTGEPGPWWDPEFRPGDNLYSDSTIALDVNTGKLSWYFQEVPNDSWDLDSVNPRLLYDVVIDGLKQKVMGNFSPNGYYYTLDRANGTFLRGDKYIKVTWTAGLDPKTGKPLEYDPNVDLQPYAGLATRRDSPSNTCPYGLGATKYFPSTFDTERMWAYSVGSVACGGFTVSEPMDFNKDWRGERLCCKTQEIVGRELGHITAIDVRTGEVMAKHIAPYPIRSGLLSTGGDLVFTGHVDGKIAAYDSDTLAEIWSINVGMPIHAPPITYSVDGKQYIAIVAGGSNRSDPLMVAGSTLYVFGL